MCIYVLIGQLLYVRYQFTSSKSEIKSNAGVKIETDDKSISFQFWSVQCSHWPIKAKTRVANVTSHRLIGSSFIGQLWLAAVLQRHVGLQGGNENKVCSSDCKHVTIYLLQTVFLFSAEVKKVLKAVYSGPVINLYE